MSRINFGDLTNLPFRGSCRNIGDPVENTIFTLNLCNEVKKTMELMKGCMAMSGRT